MNIQTLARYAANEAVDSLLTTLDCNSFDFEQLETELADWLAQRLQQAKALSTRG